MEKQKIGQARGFWTPAFIKMCLIYAVISFSTQFQATTFPLYVQSLGGGLATAGMMTSIYMASSALCKPFVGSAIGRLPKRGTLIFSGIFFAAFVSVFGFLKSIPLMMLIRVFTAPFYSLCCVAAMTITTDMLTEDTMVEGLGYYNLAQTLSYAVGPSLALMLIQNYSYRALFIACSAFALLAVLIATTLRYQEPEKREWRKKPEGQAEEKRVSFRESLRWLGKKEILVPSLMLFIVLLGTGGLVTFLPTWAKAANIDNIGIFYTVQAVALAVSRLFVGRVSERLGISRTVFISVLFIAACLLGITWCTALWQLLILSVLYGFGFGALVPSLHAVVVLSTEKKARGMANSAVQMANDAGLCLCSVSLGVIAQAIGINRIFLVAGTFPLLSLTVYFLALRPQIHRLSQKGAVSNGA